MTNMIEITYIYKTNRDIVIFVLIFLISTLIILYVSSISVNAGESEIDKCLVIVSGYGGYPSNEISKASSFYEYLNCPDKAITYLTNQSDPDSEGPANVSNVEAAFEWLESHSQPSDEVTIYISDHEKRCWNETYFVFDDGNISAESIKLWLEGVQCSKMTLILNGKRSGLAGPELYDTNRDVICSMGSDQDFDPDLFNITRSLEDTSADTDGDGEVSYIEAYWKEVENLQGSGQDPCIWI